MKVAKADKACEAKNDYSYKALFSGAAKTGQAESVIHRESG